MTQNRIDGHAKKFTPKAMDWFWRVSNRVANIPESRHAGIEIILDWDGDGNGQIFPKFSAIFRHFAKMLGYLIGALAPEWLRNPGIRMDTPSV